MCKNNIRNEIAKSMRVNVNTVMEFDSGKWSAQLNWNGKILLLLFYQTYCLETLQYESSQIF